MLGIKNVLQFPKLKFYKKSFITKKIYKDNTVLKLTKDDEIELSEEANSVNLYKLDWTDFDKRKEDNFNEWKNTHWKNSDIWYVKSLPNFYDKQFSNLVFSLNSSYLKEIQRCCRCGKYEWDKNWSFDTSVREKCLTISEKYVNVAFYLLSDCLFNSDTHYWDRRVDFCRMALSGMLYKFWGGQTGRGLIYKRAGLDELQKTLNSKDIDKFIVAVDIHEKAIEKSLAGMSSIDKTNSPNIN